MSEQASYIATYTDGYINASDVEDDLVLQANIAGATEENAYAYGKYDAEDYVHNGTYVVQRVLSAQVEHEDKLQRHNLFQIYFIINKCRVRTIIDGGSCNNLVSADFA